MGLVHVIFDVTGGLVLAAAAVCGYTMRKVICGLVMSALPRRAEKTPRPQHAKVGVVEDVNILTREAPVSDRSFFLTADIWKKSEERDGTEVR